MKTISDISALGIALVIAPCAIAAPVELTDRQMEQVAAGSTDYDVGDAVQGSGGAIVGNSSTASISTSGAVTIGDSVQTGARAVNLVNSAESGVANGVNIWDGSVDVETSATQLDVQQSNAILQDQLRMANMPNYVRTEANVEHSISESAETTHAGGVETTQLIFGQSLRAGEGVSIAGQLDADLTGGRFELSNNIHTEISGEISVGADGILGGIGASAGASLETDLTQSLDWTLPSLSLSVKGAGCYVEMGECTSEGSYSASSEETTISRSPFTLQDAAAEYIVVDDSALSAENSYTVALAGSAQTDLRALNLVNAAGSAVANAINVARTPALGPNLSLSQTNSIGATHHDAGNPGQSSGGAIVGNSSSADIASGGSVTLGGEVQVGAVAVNLVNSAESGVANGVNIWNGSMDTQSAATHLDVEQANLIIQDQAHTASMPMYLRNEANVDRTLTDTTTTTHQGSVQTLQEIIGLEIRSGVGVSIAGQLDADLEGGRIELANQASLHFTGEVSGGIEGIFGELETGVDTELLAETTQSLIWTLPDLTLSVKGAGCYVAMGSCDSSGEYSNNSSETTITRSPFTLKDARAEQIVVDGSTLTTSSVYTVALAGGAQANARAVNLVNSAGSVVANAVNVSRTPMLRPNLGLTQVNTIVQRR